MNKQLLNDFISKYHMSGNSNSVIWSLDGNGGISIKFVSNDKSVLGNVKLLKDGPMIHNDQLPIYETDTLQKLLSVLNDDVNIEVIMRNNKPISLKMKDSINVSVDFALADISTIEKAPVLKYVPSKFELSINLTEEIINTFIRAKNAMSSMSLVTIQTIQDINGDFSARLILANSFDNNVNVNRVFIPVECNKIEKISELSFNADILKYILSSNKNSAVTMEISSEGLAKMQFNTEYFDATYYLVAKSENIGD